MNIDVDLTWGSDADDLYIRVMATARSSGVMVADVAQAMRAKLASSCPDYRADRLTGERLLVINDSFDSVISPVLAGQSLYYVETQARSWQPAKKVKLSDDYILGLPPLKQVGLKVEAEIAVGFGVKGGVSIQGSAADIDSFARAGLKFAPLSAFYDSKSGSDDYLLVGFLEVVPFAVSADFDESWGWLDGLQFKYENRAEVQVLIYNLERGSWSFKKIGQHEGLSMPETLLAMAIDAFVPDVSLGWEGGEWTGGEIWKEAGKGNSKPSKWSPGVSGGLKDFSVKPLGGGQRISADVEISAGLSSTFYFAPQFALFFDFAIKGAFTFSLSLDRPNAPLDPSTPKGISS